MKNIFKILVTIVFSLFASLSSLQAGSGVVDLNVSLSIPVAVVEATQPYTNLITISNLNPAGDTLDAYGAQITYNLPNGATYSSSTGTGWTCIDSTTYITCTYEGSLQGGMTSNQLSLQTNAPNNVTTLNPTVSVLLSGATDPDTSNNNATDSIKTGKSNLSATKTASKTLLSSGEAFFYTITVENNNLGTTTVPARNVTIIDPLPAGISFGSTNASGFTCSESGGTITCNGLDLAVGDTKTVTINATATPGGTDLVNTATVTSDSSDYNAMPLTKSVTVDVQLADIELTQTLVNGLTSNTAAVESNVTYRLHIVNLGATPAQNVSLINTLPTDSTLVSTGTGWNCGTTSPFTCTLNDTNLTTNENYDLDIVVTMPNSVGSITNSAVASTTSTETILGNNSTSLEVTVKGADLDIVKTPDLGSADIGTDYTYTITTTNAGLVTAQNVVVTDTLDANMKYVSDTGSCTGVAVGNTGTLTCNLANIGPSGANNNVFTVTVTMPTDSLTDVTNTASVVTSTGQENSTNLSSTVTTHITGPNLNITKDANVTDVGLGKTFSYDINITNVNTAPAKTVNIKDQLPSGVEIIGIISNPDSWTCPTTASAGSIFNCTQANFLGSSTSHITFEAKASSSAPGEQINTATISHSLNTNDGSASATVNIKGIVLTPHKSASAEAITGGLIDYNLTIQNDSLSDAANLTLADNLASLGTGYTIDSYTATGWDCSSSTTTTLTCTKPTLLAEGGTSTINLKVRVPNNATLTTVTNSVSITTTTLPTPTVTATADTIIRGADIVVIPPTTTTAIANENVVFTVQVRNDGTATAQDVNLTNTFNTSNKANFLNLKIDCNNDGTYDVFTAPYTCSFGNIAPAGIKTIKISATAPNYDSQFPGNSNILNTSTAVTSTSQSTTTNDTSNWSTQIRGADLLINKTSNLAEVAANGLVTYTITVKNQWEANATNIQVTDDILGTSPDAFSFTTNPSHDADWTCTVQTSAKFVCNYNPAVLSYNQTTSPITIVAQAPNVLNAIDNSRINQAVVTTNTAEKETGNTNIDVVSVTIRGADLNISKTVSPTTAKLGEVVTFTILVRNNDLADANNTFVDDTLPAGFTAISTVGCGASSSIVGNTVHCTLGNLAQNASTSFTITANAPITNGTYINTATTTSDTLEKNTADNSDDATLIVEGADLVMNKIAPARVAGNSYFTYTLNIQNIGHSTAYGATLSDTLPTNVNYVGPLASINGDWNCTESSSVISCQTTDSNLSILPGYNQNIVSFLVQANSAHYWINNTAVVDTNTSESNTANNTDIAATEVINVDLAARKLINGTNYGATENYIDINGTITYALQVANISLVDINITDVNVTDLIPPAPKVSNVSVAPNARFTCNTPTSPGQTLTCTMNNGLTTPLQRSEGWIPVATITVTAIDAVNFDINNENNNLITNRYKAETTLSDEQLNNNAPVGDWLYTNTLVRGANMSVDKTVSSTTVSANQPFSYNLAIKNWPRTSTTNRDEPSTSATGIVVKDTLPANVSYISATGTNWSCSEVLGIITCNYTGSISPANTNSNITVNVSAPNTHNEVLSNEANVTNATPELIRLLPDNIDTITTTTQGTDITITKTGPATAGMSDSIIYSITVTNTSATTPASGITVLDTLPNGGTYDDNLTGANWSLGTDVGSKKQFIYDINLTAGASTTFTYSSTLPHYTGIARNSAEANTTTVETASPNISDFDTNILGADIVFAADPSQTPNPVGAYGVHQYTMQVKNQGLSDASDINVTFDFNDMGSTPGWSDANGTGTNWSCDAFDTNNSKLVCHLPTLLGSSNSNTLTISSIAPNYNDSINNSVTVIGKDDTNTTTGETKSVETTIKGSDLHITKSAHDPDPLSDGLYHNINITVGVGKTVDFNLSVRNDNLGLAKAITVTDTLPTGFTDLNITNQNDWTCSFASNTLTCNRAELAPNTTAPDILISATAPNSILTVTNTADVNTTTVDIGTHSSDSVNITTEGATLVATLTPSKTQVAMGEIFTYDLNITNTGRNPAIDVNITDVLNNDFNFTSIAGSGANWTCVDTNGTIDCNQPLIVAYSGNTILKLNVMAPVNKKGTYTNSADINSSSIASPISVPAIPDVRVVGADLIVDINATPTDVLEDRNVTYTIGIKDINISTAYDVNLTVTFSQALNDLNITNADGGTCSVDSNISISCSFGNLIYNADKNITLYGTMPFTDTVINALSATAVVTTSSTQENTTNDTATVDVKVNPIKPIADYRFEECKWPASPAGSVVDSIGGFNGTPVNGPVTLNHLLSFDDNNFSSPGRTGLFDGINDSITIPNNTQLQIVKNQTICMWLKPSNFNSRKNPYSKAYGGEGTITQETSGSLTYYYGTNGGNSSPYQGFSSQSLVLNQWNYACLVRDLKNMQLSWYIDGVNTNNAIASFSVATAGDKPVIIGDGYTHNYAGNIDEVEIYNIALDDRAINDIYNFEKAQKNYDGTDRNETVCGVDLSVVKTALPLGNIGAESNLTYNITVTNLSAEPVVDGFSLTDTLPGFVTYSSDSFSSNLSCTGTSDMNCTFPNTLIMKQGEFETITINVETANKDKQPITNSAIATPIQPDDVPGNNTGSVTNQIIGTDLQITKTATPSFPNPAAPFIYTVKVTNISSLANARDIVMLDTFDTRLAYAGQITIGTNETNSTISCSDNSNTITCNIDKLSMGNFAEFNITMQSPNVATNLINEANVTSITKDTYLANNHTSISIDTNTTAAGVNIIEIVQKDFHNDANVNTYGNIATIGNTILVSPGILAGTRLNEVNSTYANSLGGIHVNSSSATLKMLDTNVSNPDDNITIEYAGLFWGGHIHGSDKNETGNNIPFNQITFFTPDGATHTISADKNDTNISSNAPNRLGYYHFKKGDENNISSQIGSYRIFYGAKADITSLVRGLANPEGSYSVADMNVTKGVDYKDWAPSGLDWEKFRDYGYFGGWSMVVVYSINHKYHREVKFKNLSSFSGFKIMTPASPGAIVTLPINIDGFLTPLSGDIQSSLYTLIQGGDRELSLENMSVEDKNGTANFVREDLNNTNNILNDTITLKDATNTPITKLPNELYNVGTDIDQFNLDSHYDSNGNCINTGGKPCYLSNQQSQTIVTMSVSEASLISNFEYPSEQAFAQMMSMETQIFTPDFIDSYKECFKLEEPLNPDGNWVPCSEDLPLLRRGDKIKYRITAINTGDDFANDVYISDLIPQEVTYDANSTIVSNLYHFNDFAPPVSPCIDPNYESSVVVRDACVADLKAILIDNNDTHPFYTLPDGTDDNLDIINTGFNDISYGNVNKKLVIHFPTFAKNHVVWIEFIGTINGSSRLGRTFENSISIEFTNPTLANANLPGSTVTQVSDPVVSSPINFNWDDINITVSDVGRSTVGTKIVNQPFNLDINLTGLSALDILDVNTTMHINSFRIVDINDTSINDAGVAFTSITDKDANKSLANVSWTSLNTSYGRASRGLGFDMNISIFNSDNNFSDSKLFPRDFPGIYEPDHKPYTGDLFSVRPASFDINLTGATVSGVYNIVTAGAPNLSMSLKAPDINGINLSLGYNASLSQGTGIDIGLDSNFSTNPLCVSLSDFNITDANFTDGTTTVSNIKYNEVGVIKVILQDINWTAIDQPADCNATSGDNSLTGDGLVSCTIDGNSSSVVFKPDHFTFTSTTVANNNASGFTYMVNNPITDPMFSTITTTLESRNADDNITTFFSNVCFANDVNVTLTYDAQSKTLGDLNISIANENNLTNISSNGAVGLTNSDITIAYDNNFSGGTSTVTYRLAVDRNKTTLPIQPAFLDATDLNGSITGYLGITSADVSDANGTDISATSNLYYYFGRVHSPDYRFAGRTGTARVYYETYCKDCNSTELNNFDINGTESVDSVNWYINTLHTLPIYGGVYPYKTIENVTIEGLDDTFNSTTITNGAEDITVAVPLTESLPYKDKAEMNATDWITFAPKDFLLEFQDDQKDWAGQGELGHIIDTNVSKRSNRRLEW